MTLVIADTSPLQYLYQAGVIDLLPSLFTTVQVPEAVRDELQIGRQLGFDVPDLRIPMDGDPSHDAIVCTRILRARCR